MNTIENNNQNDPNRKNSGAMPFFLILGGMTVLLIASKLIYDLVAG